MMERVNGIVGGVALFIVILFGMWHWSDRHESAIKDWWRLALQQPSIESLRLRFATQIVFVRARLSPHGYFGLQMTAGALALIGAAWLFGGIAEDVLTGDPLTIVDRRIAEWFQSQASPLVAQWMRVVSNLHGVVAISAYVALLALYLIWKRDWVWLVCLGATVPGGMLLNVMMKHAFHRARPDTVQALVTVTTYSFPSGHVAGTTLSYGLLAAMLISRIDIWRWRVLIAFSLIAVVLVVALSRMYLGVHYLSDVLAALAEAVVWLLLCLMSVHTWWQRRTEGRGKGNCNASE